MNGIPFPDIDPIALQIGPIAIRWYALAYIAGLFGGLLYAKRLAANDALWGAIKRPTATDLDDLLLYATLGVILGGRIGYVMFYQPGYFLAKPLEILSIWSGGMSFHGGFAGAVVAMILFARARGLPMLSLFDLIGTVAPIGLMFAASPTSSTANSGAGRPMWPGASSFPMAGRWRAIRASSTKRRRRGFCCSLSLPS